MLQRLYAQHDHALAQWRDTLREVRRLGRQFWEIAEFKKCPASAKSAPMSLARSSRIRPASPAGEKLIKYARLAITDRSSDGKPLGYKRLERRGHRELKNLSYHAWRTACKSTTRDNAVQGFYRASLARIHDLRHARLNTQRKILGALWRMWRRREAFAPERFFPSQRPTRQRGWAACVWRRRRLTTPASVAPAGSRKTPAAHTRPCAWTGTRFGGTFLPGVPSPVSHEWCGRRQLPTHSPG
jgi:hypothetical protein